MGAAGGALQLEAIVYSKMGTSIITPNAHCFLPLRSLEGSQMEGGIWQVHPLQHPSDAFVRALFPVFFGEVATCTPTSLNVYDDGLRFRRPVSRPGDRHACLSTLLQASGSPCSLIRPIRLDA